MTQTLPPREVGQTLHNLAPYIPGVIALRPVGVDELHRLSAGETLTLPAAASLPPPRQGVPTTYEPRRPRRYRATHRRRSTAPRWTLALIGSLLAVESAAALAVLSGAKW